MPSLVQALIITFLFCENTGQVFSRPDFELIRQKTNPMGFMCDVNSNTRKLDCTISLLDGGNWQNDGEKNNIRTESYDVFSDPSVPGRLTLKDESQDEQIEIVGSKAVLMQRITQETSTFTKVCSGKVSTFDSISSSGDPDCRLFFNPENISKDRLNGLRPLFPGARRISVSLSACMDNHQQSFFGETERYRNCGSRDIKATDFFHNAKVNLAIGRSYVAMLEAIDVPKELEWSRTERLLSVLKTTAITAQIIKYLESNDISYLQEKILKINPYLKCSEVLGRIKRAKTKIEKARIAEIDWNNCINHAMGDTHHNVDDRIFGWNNFLKKYNINEVCDSLH
jgi:hypothetical protein